MLQIIGWLGCFYLVVKALEIASSDSFRTSDGKMKDRAQVATWVAWGGAIAFALWLYVQGVRPGDSGDTAPFEQLPQSKIDCINRAKTSDEILAC